MTVTETFYHLNVKWTVMVRSAAIIYWPFTWAIDMPSALAKESQIQILFKY